MKVTWSLMSPFPHAVYLSLPDHIHDLVALQRSPCRLEGKEAHPWLDQPLDKTVVLLDQTVQVFDLPKFDCFGKDSSGFERCHGLRRGLCWLRAPWYAR
jgi:hypothetical protein